MALFRQMLEICSLLVWILAEDLSQAFEAVRRGLEWLHGIAGPSPSPSEDDGLLTIYLLQNSAEFRECHRLRKMGWQSPEADNHFNKQRERTDGNSYKSAHGYYNIMKNIADELDDSTGCFTIAKDIAYPKILDLCVAPGEFLRKALYVNPTAYATGFTLPHQSGGHKPLLQMTRRVSIKPLDITMLAEDMGSGIIPHDHPESDRFLPRALHSDKMFDLVICDGQILRGQTLYGHGELVEGHRLRCSQLVLGLEHLKPGGTLVMLMHKLDRAGTAELLYRFSQFANIQAYKPTSAHTIKGSFYMIASQVQSRSPHALVAIEKWRGTWASLTFDIGATNEEQKEVVFAERIGEEEVVRNFGPQLVELGRQVWEAQSEGLRKSSFVKSAD